MSIQKIFLDKPLDMVYLDLSFVQKWKILMKKLEKSKVEGVYRV
jgi:hypothetical protein